LASAHWIPPEPKLTELIASGCFDYEHVYLLLQY
jgi:hypothetical protein